MPPSKTLTKGMGLYGVKNMASQAPNKSKPWCVVNLDTGDVNGRWHVTKAQAEDQLKAMYASMGNKARYGMGEMNFLVPLQFAETKFGDDGLLYIEALKAKTYHTPYYGEVVVTPDKLKRFKENFDKNVRGIELATDYDHGQDVNKGNKASGWIKKVELDNDSLIYGVQLTETAKQEIESGEWRYFSADWLDQYVHEDGTPHEDVLCGGGFTNRPIAKSLMPINFSEVFIEVDDSTKFAVWSTSYINNLPDSSFLWVESGGSKDKEGKTVPRTLRHLPYKDANGKIDLPHLRNAIARASQMKDVTDSMKAALKTKATRLLGAKQMSEAGVVTQEYVATIEATNPAEFMEPGSGNIDYGLGRNDDSAPNRIDTPPGGEDGSVPDRSETVENKVQTEGGEMDELEKQLRQTFNLADDVDVVKYVSDGLTELQGLKDTAKQFSEHKKFAEQYPDEYSRMQRLEDESRVLRATQFSESLASRRVVQPGENDDATETPTNLGLSGAALEAAKDIHKKFSEGTATLDDFTGFMDTLYRGGVVEYGERGSTSPSVIDSEIPTNVIDIRKKFSEKVEEVRSQDEFKDKPYEELIAVAAERNPTLYQAYLNRNASKAS